MIPAEVSSVRWRTLMASELADVNYGSARLQYRELTAPAGAEAAFTVTVTDNGSVIGHTALALYRRGGQLRGYLTKPVTGSDSQAEGLVWRALALMANSLRLQGLHWTGEDGHASADRHQLKLGAKVAERLEIERIATAHRFSRSRLTAEGPVASTAVSPLALRIEPGSKPPVWKRTVDLGLGTTAALATTPLWICAAVLVRRSSPGPVLYQQVRIGAGGLPFQIYKFRTMFVDNDDSAHRLQNKLELQGVAEAAKDSDDPRVTSIGRVLRRLSLDELPQLINVIRSEMSLVGPRPSLLWESELFDPRSRRRLRVQPGLTGLWQISGRADISMSDMLELDLEYLDQSGPMIDLRCLVGTVASVAAGEGAK